MAHLPGQRLACVADTARARQRLIRERQLLRLLADRASFPVPRSEWVDPNGHWDVRLKVPGDAGHWSAKDLSKNESAMIYMDVPPSWYLQRRTPMQPDRGPQRPSWELPEALCQRMEPLIPAKKGKTGHPRTADLRRMTEGICSVLRTGGQWQACPRERFGPPSTVDYDFAP